MMFTRRCGNENIVALRPRVRGILALLNSTRGKKRMEFVNRDLSADTKISRCVVLKRTPPQLTRMNFMGQPLLLKEYKEKLNPFAVGRPEHDCKVSARE